MSQSSINISENETNGCDGESQRKVRKFELTLLPVSVALLTTVLVLIGSLRFRRISTNFFNFQSQNNLIDQSNLWDNSSSCNTFKRQNSNEQRIVTVFLLLNRFFMRNFVQSWQLNGHKSTFGMWLNTHHKRSNSIWRIFELK